jgi:hypothetical protein
MQRFHALLLSFGVAAWAQPAEADAVEGFCEQVSRSIDTLASTFHTSCVPTAGGKPGVYSALVIAGAPVFANEKSKRAFLTVACAAAGNEMNKNGRLRLNELWFSDIESTKQRIAYSVPALECKQMQAKVSAGTMRVEDMHARLESKLVRREVAK